MKHAEITGWGKCLPPATLTNDDLATFLDTNDEWIYSRTGMKNRRISHVELGELGRVAAERALACADLDAADVDLIVFGSTTFSELAPNTASFVQKAIGAKNAACMDVNTACTSGMYALTTANAMIRSGVVKNALVLGGEVISKLMDWEDRSVAVLFGDGCAALVLQESEEEVGLLSETLGCYGDNREILLIEGHGTQYANKGIVSGETVWQFEGQEIFKRAVKGMAKGSAEAMAKLGINIDNIDWVIPHQANVRIVEYVGKKLGVPDDKVFVNIERYGNMSAATATIALIEAVEEGHIQPGQLILQPAFGAGLTWSAHIIKWGSRVKPLRESEAELAPCDKSALDIVNEIRRQKRISANIAEQYKTGAFD